MAQQIIANGREKVVNRQIHRLFWKSILTAKPQIVIWFFTRPPAFAVLHAIIPLYVAYALQAIITRHFDQVGHYLAVIAGLAVLHAILWTVGGLMASKLGEISGQHLQMAVIKNYLGKDYDFYANNYAGSISGQALRLRDAFQEYSGAAFLQIPKYIVIITASFAVLAAKSLPLAMITFVCVAIILGFTYMISLWRFKYRRKLSDVASNVDGKIGDALSNAITIKTFAAEQYELASLSKPLAKFNRVQYISWITSIPADVGRNSLAMAATVLLLFGTSQLYQQNKIALAMVILVQLYVLRLVTLATEIAEFTKTYERTMSAAYNAVKTMMVAPVITDVQRPKTITASDKLVLKLTNVTFKYGKRAAVRDVSLTVQPGTKVGVVGYSGSGKTTLTRLLLRFMDTSAGTIELAGVDIRDLRQSQLRSLISYVPQEPLLFHRSIAENIGYGITGCTRAEIEAAGKAAYVDEFIADLPYGYDTLVGEKGIKLSGGQRQRVAIARAILRNAPILVLDEATSALDSRSEQYIQKALWNLMKGRTALVVAHRLSTIQRMDTIIVMDGGTIIESGTHEELIERPDGVYAGLWEHQSGGYISPEKTAH